MSKVKKQLDRILKNNYGVRSGVYSAIHAPIKMQMDEYGEYQPLFRGDETAEVYEKLLSVDMMSDISLNESEISKHIFSEQKAIKYDSVLGYYNHLYAGYVAESDYRERGSSGGMTSWILAELLRLHMVDGVIHAHPTDPSKHDGHLFEYTISYTQEKIKDGSKTRYYPMELSNVLRTVMKKPGRYAVVGIPEFITELRLLAIQNPVINERIKYTIGLICGHQKTAKYVEALAWQHGIKPGDLKSVDFRVKQEDRPAIDYLHEFKGVVNGRAQKITKNHSELFAESWAAGFFKSKFSDFTDNTFNETADVALGDAWLPGYEEDGLGNNVLIVRNTEIAKLINDAIKEKRLKLNIVDEQTIKDSQAGLIHHTRDELPYRLAHQKSFGKWVPKKRVRPSFNIPHLRKRVQNVRYEMATKSHVIFQEAVSRNDWNYFETEMTKLFGKYKFLYQMINWEKEGYVNILRKRVRIRTRTKIALHAIKHKTRIGTRIRDVGVKINTRRVQNKYKNYDGVIVTLTGYFNYGNIVQRYALQRFLQKKGYKFVSYASEPFDVSGAEFNRFKHTASFVDKWIDRKHFDPNDDFSSYIVGSDQVWRNWGYENEKTDLGFYFFDFIKNATATRIAYAASFGQEKFEDTMISDEFVKYSTPLLKKFSAISVREESAVAIMHNIWQQEATIVLDPTMLLSIADYNLIIEGTEQPLEQVEGIFSYILAVTDNKERIVKKISNATKDPITTFYPKQLEVLPPVEQWLMGFRDSKFVVTDSFHGTVFAILNNTPFVVIENDYGGTARITSLLEQFNLQDRLVFEGNARDFNPLSLGIIDWRDVNKRLLALREASGDWLLESIESKSESE